MTSQKDHCIDTIRRSIDLLSPDQLRHIDFCASCRREYQVYLRLEQAIRSLPLVDMPPAVRHRILEQVLIPGYRLSHLVAALLFACMTPLMLLLFDVRDLFGTGLTVGLFGGSGILIALLIIPITDYLILRHRVDVDYLKNRIDGLLARRTP